MMENLGIKTYFSGCLTLTLNREPSIKKQNFILAIDVPDAVYNKMQSTSNYPIIRLSVYSTYPNMSIEDRFVLAQYYLYLYQAARHVITFRIHSTLPCLAFETPVLHLIKPGFESSRFAGVIDLAHHMTIDDYLKSNWDINNPPENPKDYIPVREKLEKICAEYTGFSSNKSFLDGKSLDELLLNPRLIETVMVGTHLGAHFRKLRGY